MEEKTYTKNDIMEALNRTKVIIVPEAVELETQAFAEMCAGAELLVETLMEGLSEEEVKIRKMKIMVTSFIEELSCLAESAEKKLKENG